MYGSPASFVDFHVDVLQHGRVDIAIHRMLHDNLVHEQRVEIREAKDRREIFALYFLVVLFACSVRVISLGLYWLQQSRKAKSRRDHRMRRSLHEDPSTNLTQIVVVDNNNVRGNNNDTDIDNNDEMWSMLLKDKLFA
jgi:hypothetical protein